MMNATEKKAFQWLVDKGHTGIVFRQRTSPDFLTEQGIGYEVKKARNHTIFFGQSQILTLKRLPDTQIVVFNDNESPIAQFPFSEIMDEKTTRGNLHISYGLGVGQVRIQKVTLERLAKLKRPGQTYDGVLQELLEKISADDLREEMRKQAACWND